MSGVCSSVIEKKQKKHPHVISPGRNCDIDDCLPVITGVVYSSIFSKFIPKLLITGKSWKAFSLLKTQVGLNLQY